MISRRTFLGSALATASLAGCASGPRLLTYDGPPVTSVVVNKGARQMYLLSGSTVVCDHRIDLGSNPVGPKRVEGDGRTPEGLYFVDRHNPRSQYYLSVGISYPNAQDVALAQAMGQRPGGDIFFHGTPPEKPRGTDWTAGCMAVSNDEIEEIYAMLREGTPVFINP
jgi:murein L,D-transpeptidase YafK